MSFLSKFRIKIVDESALSAPQSCEELLALQITPSMRATSQAILLADVKGIVTFVNDAALQLLTNYENDIQGRISAFSIKSLIGAHINVFISPHTFSVATDRKAEKQQFERQFADAYFTLEFIPLYSNDERFIGTMIEWRDVSSAKQQAAIIQSIDESQAVIEFTPDGIIKRANKNFVLGMGYELSEIVGKHHRMFMPDNMKNSEEYASFWNRLKQGEFFKDEVRRIAKGNREIWLSAAYNPLLDENGKVTGVIKFATDITQQKLQINDYIGQINAINNSYAVIEFDLDGIIHSANDAFLSTTGYSIDEIQGKHHRLFVTSDYAASDEYASLWDDLRAGKFFSDEIKRVAKDGSTLWLQGSYNPIFDANGRPYKVVKYAVNITQRKNAIEAIRRVIHELTEGDLTARIDLDSENEFYELADSINAFVGHLNSVMNDLRIASDTIKTAANEIAKGNADLSVRTEKQASSVEETASTMEDLTNTVQINSKSANQANKLSTGASEIATKGGGLIEQVVSTMSSITESSRKISDIIGVIDGIAFQTNILALNAAVEAARAGEQGRGFAVVASEVRNLAQRSANAAKDIKDLISVSVSKIEVGNEIVNESGITMRSIVASIAEVNDIISKIDTASSEQAFGIQEIGQAIKQMDDITQQNAALVEQAAAASESMQGQATQLANMVARFRLKNR